MWQFQARGSRKSPEIGFLGHDERKSVIQADKKLTREVVEAPGYVTWKDCNSSRRRNAGGEGGGDHGASADIQERMSVVGRQTGKKGTEGTRYRVGPGQEEKGRGPDRMASEPVCIGAKREGNGSSNGGTKGNWACGSVCVCACRAMGEREVY